MTESTYQTRQEKANTTNVTKSSEGKSYPSRTIVHAKLEMTEPGDLDEQEADSVANTIASGGKISRKISNGGSSSGITVSQQMENQLSRLQGGGQAMPSGLRHMMESGFGQDFSHVRLHTDSQAADMSSSISARAFTHGNDIYFNRGQFSPNTSEGQRLVAHELTHVVQGSGKVGRFGPDDTILLQMQNKLNEKFVFVNDENYSQRFKRDGSYRTNNSGKRVIDCDIYVSEAIRELEEGSDFDISLIEEMDNLLHENKTKEIKGCKPRFFSNTYTYKPIVISRFHALLLIVARNSYYLFDNNDIIVMSKTDYPELNEDFYQLIADHIYKDWENSGIGEKPIIIDNKEYTKTDSEDRLKYRSLNYVFPARLE